ncbi:aminoacyl-tRNA hydrolase [Paenibacillus validus]|uniref:peptidyl-tRNA hydrolase n=1 Tax=Paenibacillus validus TaxID=44253 RepID=A0A7X2Z732_9BACL|nr:MULTISPECIES: aminoacyl-tRNA hydrolase [Paenibacillus]MED4603643.1 aminoacyl-tRNA hydrolase [Paenibacillus validus]MED4609759.1 aminoacyl-tRNA hydrolase [Paenibacillus validus]MUG69467.1 peptidyl-tRNA hydrolase [Paenibacillus validus]
MQSPNRDLVQYYVVNEELSMSAGKIAAQVAHAATTMTLHVLLQDQGSHETYQAWLNQGQKKIVLKGSERELLRLTDEGYLSIRDAGHTEVPSGSLTVVVLPPMEKSIAGQSVSGLKLL